MANVSRAQFNPKTFFISRVLSVKFHFAFANFNPIICISNPTSLSSFHVLPGVISKNTPILSDFPRSEKFMSDFIPERAYHSETHRGTIIIKTRTILKWTRICSLHKSWNERSYPLRIYRKCIYFQVGKIDVKSRAYFPQGFWKWKVKPIIPPRQFIYTIIILGGVRGARDIRR